MKTYAINDQIKFMKELVKMETDFRRRDVDEGRATASDVIAHVAPYKAILETLKRAKADQNPRQLYGSQGG